MQTGFCLGHLKERHYLKGLGKDKRIIFIWIFNFNQIWNFMTDFNLLVMLNDRFSQVFSVKFHGNIPSGNRGQTARQT